VPSLPRCRPPPPARREDPRGGRVPGDPVTAASLFARPEALAVLLLAPAAWGFLHLRERSRRRELEAWVGPRVDQVSTERRTWTGAARPLVFAAAIARALAAWLDPLGPGEEVDLAGRGVDLVVCLDVSG